MTHFLRYTVKRWWWSKWHPIVRVGWVVTRVNPRGSRSQSYLGLALIGTGLVLRSRKSLLLYKDTVPAGQEIRIRVFEGGRELTAG